MSQFIHSRLNFTRNGDMYTPMRLYRNRLSTNLIKSMSDAANGAMIIKDGFGGFWCTINTRICLNYACWVGE